MSNEDKLMFDPEAKDQLTMERGICLKYDCEVIRVHEELLRCETRVKGKSYTAETCEQEIIDLMEALDHCVHDKAFVKFA